MNRSNTGTVLSWFYHNPEKKHLEVCYMTSYLVITLNFPLAYCGYMLVYILPYCPLFNGSVVDHWVQVPACHGSCSEPPRPPLQDMLSQPWETAPPQRMGNGRSVSQHVGYRQQPSAALSPLRELPPARGHGFLLGDVWVQNQLKIKKMKIPDW